MRTGDAGRRSTEEVSENDVLRSIVCANPGYRRRSKYCHYVACRPQLFDLETDPEELTDVAGEPRYAAIVAEDGAGRNNAVQNRGANSDLYFGLAANLADNVTVGVNPGSTSWKGISSDALADRTLTMRQGQIIGIAGTNG